MDVRIKDSRVKKLIRKELADGRFESETALVEAALAHFIPSQRFGDFATGELDRLLEEAESGGPDIPGEQVFEELRQLGKKARKAR